MATGDLGAWGAIGGELLARLERLLASPEVARRVRVVLIHHPPVELDEHERNRRRAEYQRKLRVADSQISAGQDGSRTRGPWNRFPSSLHRLIIPQIICTEKYK